MSDQQTRLPAFDDSDQVIAEALEHASVPTLMAAMMLIEGDYSLMDGAIKPGRGVLGEVQGFMSAEDQATIRKQALEVLKRYRDQGQSNSNSLPQLPNEATLYRMMCFVAGAELPKDSIAMMLEELALDNTDPRAIQASTIDKLTANKDTAHKVIIIGGGMSGILAAIRLQQAGLPYVLLEKNPDKGGTWYENTYPGARVDIPAHIYCYSFEPSDKWTQFYPKQHELKKYFDDCVKKYQLENNIRYGSEVISSVWNEATQQWQVSCKDSASGKTETLVANSVISAVGQLNRSLIPEIDGAKTFQGPSFHSAAFEHQHDYTDKTVAVIGSGASAFQLVPEMAKTAGAIKVFQRSPAWMFRNPGYHDDSDSGTPWLIKHVPYYARFYRFLLFWVSADALLPTLMRDDSWPHQDRSINAINDGFREQATNWIKSQVSDEKLIAKVLPSYPPFVKRILQDNGSWLAALQQDNVELITDGIESIDATGINYKTASGAEHIDVDIIIYATGFHANKWLYPMDIIGRNNSKLNEVWGDDPKAYLGISIPNFPNFYCMYGPNTNLAHAGTLFFNSECQIRYIIECMALLVENQGKSIEVKTSVNQNYNQKVQDAFAKTVWTHKGTGSWYKNSQGNITTNSPWRLADYWQWTLKPENTEYLIDQK